MKAINQQEVDVTYISCLIFQIPGFMLLNKYCSFGLIFFINKTLSGCNNNGKFVFIHNCLR